MNHVPVCCKISLEGRTPPLHIKVSGKNTDDKLNITLPTKKWCRLLKGITRHLKTSKEIISVSRAKKEDKSPILKCSYTSGFIWLLSRLSEAKLTYEQDLWIQKKLTPSCTWWQATQINSTSPIQEWMRRQSHLKRPCLQAFSKVNRTTPTSRQWLKRQCAWETKGLVLKSCKWLKKSGKKETRKTV